MCCVRLLQGLLEDKDVLCKILVRVIGRPLLHLQKPSPPTSSITISHFHLDHQRHAPRGRSETHTLGHVYGYTVLNRGGMMLDNNASPKKETW